MKIPFLIFFASTIFLALSCKKDEPTDAYLRGGNSMVETPDGNLMIAGYNRSAETGYDGYLTKVTKSGEVLWSKFYGSGNMDGFYSVINASGGGNVAVGFQDQSLYGKTSIYIVKTKEQGEIEWQYFGNGFNSTQGFSIAETPDKGFIACGYIQDDQNSDRDIYLLKVDAQGIKKWEKRYGGTKNGSLEGEFDDAYSITSAGDSGYYITGSVSGNAGCCGSSYLMRINALGDSLWMKSYSKALGYSITRMPNGNVIICGTSSSNGQDIYLLKTDSAGKTIWEKTFGTASYDYGTALVQTPDNGFALTGFAGIQGGTGLDVILYRIDSTGSLVWSKKYGDDNVEEGFGLVRDQDGSFFIAGLSNSGGSYIFLNKTNSEGEEVWRKNLY